jgi:hypothetical protein
VQSPTFPRLDIFFFYLIPYFEFNNRGKFRCGRNADETQRRGGPSAGNVLAVSVQSSCFTTTPQQVWKKIMQRDAVFLLLQMAS